MLSTALESSCNSAKQLLYLHRNASDRLHWDLPEFKTM